MMMIAVPATVNVNIDIGTAVDTGTAIDITGAGTAYVIGARIALAVPALYTLFSGASTALYALLSAASAATTTPASASCPLSYGKQNESGKDKGDQLCHE
jgi:hypothetical protein